MSEESKVDSIESTSITLTSIAQIIARSQLGHSMSISDIIALIPPGLSPVQDAHGYITDKSTIALKCIRGHVHKYYLSCVSDISCVTCGFGTKFIKFAREILEDMIGVPFIVNSEDNFINMNVRITMTCHRTSGTDTCEYSNEHPHEHPHIHIHKTESRKKIMMSVRKYLGEYITEKHLLNRCAVRAVSPSTLMRRQKTRKFCDLPVLYLEDYIIENIHLGLY